MEEQRGLKLETIERILKEGSHSDKVAAVRACKKRAETPLHLIRKWLKSDDVMVRMAGFAACVNTPELPTTLLVEAANEQSAWGDMWGEDCCEMRVKLYDQIGDALERHWLSVEKMQWWAESEDNYLRYLAMRVAGGKTGDTYNAFIANGLGDRHPKVAIAAARAAKGHWFPAKVIDMWRRSGDFYRRMAAMNAMVSRNDLPFRWIETGMCDNWEVVRAAAVMATVGRKIPERYLGRWMVAPENDEETMAVLLDFEDRVKWYPEWRYRKSARRWRRLLLDATKSRNARIARTATRLYGLEDLPLVRDCGAPSERELVHQKCLGDVNVYAKIPEEAHCRLVGLRDGVSEWRASHAVIEKVCGDFYGEEVGISLHDSETLYRAGDRVIVQDFDVGNRQQHTSGFYFYY